MHTNTLYHCFQTSASHCFHYELPLRIEHIVIIIITTELISFNKRICPFGLFSQSLDFHRNFALYQHIKLQIEVTI